MNYTSTRKDDFKVSASAAIVKGISADGGLFVPETFPKCAPQEVYGFTYPQTAAKILGLFLTEFSPEFLTEQTAVVYGGDNFSEKAGHLCHVAGNKHSLELWHGPTCAFKDYALQIMPRLLVESKRLLNDDRTTKILVATSGDTGKAALAGYTNLDKIKIAVFYPNSGTSEMQRLQMVTHGGENVSVYAVNGNFDDAQTGVKRTFANGELEKTLAERGEHLSSANSINLGRLLPQIVYYYYAYAQLVKEDKIKDGDKVNFCVPTGNFGDILAGYYAKQMGLPVNKLICASNSNDVLTEFFATGTYNAKREFYKTSSPSMDILVSSNLERLLYHITGSAQTVQDYMKQLAEKGCYTVSADVLDKINTTFEAGCANEEQTAQTIYDYAKETGYYMDPHTAVAFNVAQNLSSCNTAEQTVVLSTASPYKFPHDVLLALKENASENTFEDLQILYNVCKYTIPESLSSLKNKKVLFEEIIDASEIEDVALKM